MKKHFAIFFLISIFLTYACKEKKDNNFVELENIVNETERIVNNYDSTVSVSLNNKKTDYITILSKGANDSVNLKINDVKNLKLNPENEELKTATINYFKTLQKLIEAESKYATINDTTKINTAKMLDENVSKVINNVEQARYKYKLVAKQANN